MSERSSSQRRMRYFCGNLPRCGCWGFKSVDTVDIVGSIMCRAFTPMPGTSQAQSPVVMSPSDQFATWSKDRGAHAMRYGFYPPLGMKMDMYIRHSHSVSAGRKDSRVRRRPCQVAWFSTGGLYSMLRKNPRSRTSTLLLRRGFRSRNGRDNATPTHRNPLSKGDSHFPRTWHPVEGWSRPGQPPNTIGEFESVCAM